MTSWSSLGDCMSALLQDDITSTSGGLCLLICSNPFSTQISVKHQIVTPAQSLLSDEPLDWKEQISSEMTHVYPEGSAGAGFSSCSLPPSSCFVSEGGFEGAVRKLSHDKAAQHNAKH